MNESAIRKNKVVLVTGASRGLGRGIARQFGRFGATVYVTSRTSSEDELQKVAAEITAAGGTGVAITVDHRDAEQVEALVERIRGLSGRLDILVNNATAVHQQLARPGTFWEKPLALGDMIEVGLRSSYVMSYFAAPLMVAQRRGLIANISFYGAMTYFHGPAYGAAKAGTDKMSFDMAIDLRRHNVACVSLWPGFIYSDALAQFVGSAPKETIPAQLAKHLPDFERPEFSALILNALYEDPQLMGYSGETLIGAELGERYGICDIDGKQPPSYRATMGAPRRFVMPSAEQPMSDAPPSAAKLAATPIPQVAGWDTFVDGARELPSRMLSKLPPAMRDDPQIRQEVGRLALAAITSASLDALASDGDHPSFVPQISLALNVGQPNADTIYRVARITPGGSYRIRGLRGTLTLVRMGQAPANAADEPGIAPQTGLRPYHDFNTLTLDQHGHFDVMLSPKRPAEYDGDWWQLQPTTTKLVLRMVSSDWSNERDPTLSIERVDRSVTCPRPAAVELERRLRRAPRTAEFVGAMFVGHVEKLRQEGYVNKLKVLDVSQAGGLAGQSYYEGPYDLRDDEALIVEVQAPGQCVYRSLILTNEIYETLDWYNNHSSLNGSQAELDADGVLRIVIAAKDPGVPNWLDTAGHQRGLLQGRWTDCDSQPMPSLRKVAFKDVRASLPPETPTVTPEQREQIIRERRAAFQRRPLW